jgi:hypothetical protein
MDCERWIASDGLRWIVMDCDGLRWIAMDCDGLRWIAMDCDGWIAMDRAMDCDGMHLNGLLNSRQFKHTFTLMLPILITHDARASTIQVRALQTAQRAQNGATRSNGAARSKRRCAFKRCCTLKTALRVQTVLRAQNGATRSKRRCALNTALAAARSNEVRQGVGRGSAEGRQIS